MFVATKQIIHISTVESKLVLSYFFSLLTCKHTHTPQCYEQLSTENESYISVNQDPELTKSETKRSTLRNLS